MLRKTLLVKRTLKMSSDQGEARLGPCCQVPGFPGFQGESPLGSWWLGPWVPWRRRRTRQVGGGGEDVQIKSI